MDGSPPPGEEDTAHRRKVVVTDSRRKVVVTDSRRLEVHRPVPELRLRAWASPLTRTVHRRVRPE